MPSISAPIATSMLHRSTISGSRAALNKRLVPFASTAAISAFSVAITDGSSSTRIGGEWTIALATSNRRFMPPDSVRL